MDNIGICEYPSMTQIKRNYYKNPAFLRSSLNIRLLNEPIVPFLFVEFGVKIQVSLMTGYPFA